MQRWDHRRLRSTIWHCITVAVAAELRGGVLPIAGYRLRFVAIALADFSLVRTVSLHNDFTDQDQMIHFLKNVMMAGRHL